MRGRKPIDLLQDALLVLGVTCLGYYGYQTAEAHNFQQEQTAAFEALLDSNAIPNAAAAVASPAAAPPRIARAAPKVADGVVALLDIPRLKLSTPVMSGDGDDVLDVAVGHLPDTPMPWEAGNTAFAAHRDGLFRSLRNIRVGDEVRVRSAQGDFVYRVRETKIVMPDDLSVLAPTETQTVTLITCYPFNFVGHAPKRFVVHAERIDAAVSRQ